MRRAVILGLCTLALTLTALTAADLPRFETAAVKPVKTRPGMIIGLLTYPGGRITIRLYTLRMLIQEAFDMQSFQVSGTSAWMDEDRFNIDAEPPVTSKSSDQSSETLTDNQREMLLALLMDRFRLKFHREAKEGLVYLLVSGNGKSRLQPTVHQDSPPRVAGLLGGGAFIIGKNVSMSILAGRFSGSLEHPVLDRTGLTGSFDFSVEYPSSDPRPDAGSVAITAVQELGLRLQKSRGPVETIIIERAERPSPN